MPILDIERGVIVQPTTYGADHQVTLDGLAIAGSLDGIVMVEAGAKEVSEKQVVEALEAAVRLSHRYIPARQLPDKAVSLMDTACARVAVSQHATPPEIEDAQRRIETLNTELEIIDREAAIGIDVEDRKKTADEKLAAARAKLAELEARISELEGKRGGG